MPLAGSGPPSAYRDPYYRSERDREYDAPPPVSAAGWDCKPYQLFMVFLYEADGCGCGCGCVRPTAQLKRQIEVAPSQR